MDIALKIVAVFVLVFLNGFFVASEFAMVKVRKSRIESLALEGNKSASCAKVIVNHLNAYLSACQLGITLASLGLGWIGEPAIADLIYPIFSSFHVPEAAVHTIAFAIAFTIITALHIVLGELVPKTLAIVSAEKICLYTAIPLALFYKVSYPIIWFFNASTNIILKPFGISPTDEHSEIHTSAEIMLLVEEQYKHGLIDKTEMSIMDNVFDFSEKIAREIMVPRTDMVCFSIEDKPEEMLNKAIDEELTRYPVYVQDKDTITGFIHIKDLFRHQFKTPNAPLSSVIRPMLTVPESMSISVLFKQMKKKKSHVALVIDEYGGTSGIVTIEDILEEIVGDIQDEFDNDRESIEKIDENHWSVSGKLRLEEINEYFHSDIQSEDVDTIGGWLIHQLSAVPRQGDKVHFENLDFLITECKDKGIDRIMVTKVKKQETKEASNGLK